MWLTNFTQLSILINSAGKHSRDFRSRSRDGSADSPAKETQRWREAYRHGSRDRKYRDIGDEDRYRPQVSTALFAVSLNPFFPLKRPSSFWCKLTFFLTIQHEKHYLENSTLRLEKDKM